MVDLAVAVVIGAAFGAVVTAFVADLLTPILSIPGKHSFATSVTVHDSVFSYGRFLNDLISFVLIAAAIFFFVIKPINALAARRSKGEDAEPGTRDCPECMSEIPAGARRCAHCTAEIPSPSAALSCPGVRAEGGAGTVAAGVVEVRPSRLALRARIRTSRFTAAR